MERPTRRCRLGSGRRYRACPSLSAAPASPVMQEAAIAFALVWRGTFGGERGACVSHHQRRRQKCGRREEDWGWAGASGRERTLAVRPTTEEPYPRIRVAPVPSPLLCRSFTVWMERYDGVGVDEADEKHRGGRPAVRRVVRQGTGPRRAPSP